MVSFSVPIRVPYSSPQDTYSRFRQDEYSARVSFLYPSPRNPAVIDTWRYGYKGCKDKVFTTKGGRDNRIVYKYRSHNFKCTLLKRNGDRYALTSHKEFRLDCQVRVSHELKESRFFGYSYLDCTSRFILQALLDEHIHSIHISEEEQLSCPYPECQSKFRVPSQPTAHLGGHELAKIKSVLTKIKARRGAGAIKLNQHGGRSVASITHDNQTSPQVCRIVQSVHQEQV